MNIIFMLLGFSIILALVFLVAFLCANQSGQNDDLYTPSVRILFDDKPGKEDHSKSDEDHAKP
jgi:cbb3-type cytochrome oxidase maturation protein